MERNSALKLHKIKIPTHRYGCRGLNHSDEMKAISLQRERQAAKANSRKKNREIKTIRDVVTGGDLKVAKAILHKYPEEFNLLKVAELKTLLREVHEDVKGKKEDLVARLGSL